MNEVEKMYRNSGIKKIELDYPDNFEPFYPEFTAEKQLELIKWLINEVDYITMWHFNNSKKPYDFDLGSRNSGGETFEDAFAQMINNIWQDLTEEERTQIKEILSE